MILLIVCAQKYVGINLNYSVATTKLIPADKHVSKNFCVDRTF